MAPLETALQHLGPLHPAEQALTLGLAFGPFLLLGLTIWLSRRRDAREREAEAQEQVEAQPGPEPETAEDDHPTRRPGKNDTL